MYKNHPTINSSNLSQTHNALGNLDAEISDFSSNVDSVSGVSTISPHALLEMDLPRARREPSDWDLREVGWNHSPTKSTKLCGRCAISKNDGVDIEATAKSISVGGVGYCKKFFCAGCASFKSAEQTEILKHGMIGAEQIGLQQYSITLTIPTDKMSIYQQYNVLNKCRSELRVLLKQKLTRLYGKDCKIYQAYSYDVTFRMIKSQLQPHLHIHTAIACSDALPQEYIKETWVRLVKKYTYSGIHLFKNAVLIEPIYSNNFAQYIFKSVSSDIISRSKQGNTKTSGSYTIKDLIVILYDNSRIKTAKVTFNAALKAYKDIAICFINKTWSHIGGYKGLSSLDGVKQEIEEKTEEVTEYIEFSAITWNVLCDAPKFREKIFKSMMKSESQKIEHIRNLNECISSNYPTKYQKSDLDSAKREWIFALQQIY